MSSKECFKCSTVKPLSEFYRHPKMGDGYLNKCKDCAKKDVDAREKWLRANNPEWLAKERERCRNKQELARTLGTASPTTKATRIKWALNNSNKIRAQRKAAWALKLGIISKSSTCNRCGASGVKLEGHHEDYSKPLAVEWLCTKCHGLTRRIDK